MCKVEDELDKETDTLRLGVEIIDDIDKNETLVEVLPTKIEWTLKNMKSKMKYYKKDIALYSAEFTAGGVEKLRLKLYPNGKKEADAGWCSVYLEAPKGAELRCRLSVGKKSMQGCLIDPGLRGRQAAKLRRAHSWLYRRPFLQLNIKYSLE